MPLPPEFWTQIERQRQAEQIRINSANLRKTTCKGVPFCDLGSIVIIDCPNCQRRMTFRVDFSTRSPEHLAGQCESCSTIVDAYAPRDIPSVWKVEIVSFTPPERASDHVDDRD